MLQKQDGEKTTTLENKMYVYKSDSKSLKN